MLARPILAAAKERGIKVPPQLPHAVLFYTAGELTARELKTHGIEYTHFAHPKIYTNMCGPDCEDKMAVHWTPHLEGKAIDRGIAVCPRRHLQIAGGAGRKY